MKPLRVLAILAAILSAGLASVAVPTLAAPSGGPPGEGVPAPGATTQPAINWPDLLARLGSAEFAVREQAQKDLGRVDYRQYETIKGFAKKTGDPEVRLRLEVRIAEIAEQLALDPPPISLDVKDATPGELAAALTKALQVPAGPFPSDLPERPDWVGDSHDRFTLRAVDKPFWEVFTALNRQHGLQVPQIDEDGVHLVPGPPLGQATCIGGFAVFPVSIIRSTTVNLQNAGGQQVGPEQMTLYCTIMADPRIKVLRHAETHFTEVIDDAGHVLLKMPASGLGYWSWNLRQSAWSNAAALNIPRNLGKKIASAKGVAYAEVQLSGAAVEIAAFETKFQEPVAVGGRTITFTQLELGEGVLRVKCTATPPVDDVPGQDNPDRPPMEIRLIGANGQTATSTSVTGDMSGRYGGEFTAPIKLQISVPTKARRITVPFELKDLPLPPGGQP